MNGAAPVNPGTVFYSAPAFANQALTFELPSSEEPCLRAFLHEAARLGGRGA